MQNKYHFYCTEKCAHTRTLDVEVYSDEDLLIGTFEVQFYWDFMEDQYKYDVTLIKWNEDEEVTIKQADEAYESLCRNVDNEFHWFYDEIREEENNRYDDEDFGDFVGFI
jgi:hypothetical protein